MSRDTIENINFNVPLSYGAVASILCFLPELQKIRPSEVFLHEPGEVLSEEPLTIRLQGEYHPLVEQFRTALCENGFVRIFDWARFEERAQELHKHPKILRRASLTTCVKLLTLHVRMDRFVAGHFAAMLAQGHLLAILERIASLTAPQEVR